VKWIDAEDIGIALSERYPEIDPLTVRFTDLRSNEPKLEAIQMAWHEEHQEKLKLKSEK
jgi:Fe-S-cluster formation regulator IscX/YfhJ